MSLSRPRWNLVSSVVAAGLVLASCASPTLTPSPTVSTSSTAPSPRASAAPPSVSTSSTAPTASTTGFAFDAKDVVAYYEGQGYRCTGEAPSTKAAGFFFRTCELADDAGRLRVIGVVTDPNGDLANGFASVQGKDTEAFLAPIDALEPLAGFLGAMLGEDQGSKLLPWLAGHLGDSYAETKTGPIKVATYTESESDHSKLYVEMANQTYLGAPGLRSP